MFTTPLREICIRVGEWLLTDSLTWAQSDHGIDLKITVPMRFVTDHASVPKFLRGLLVDSGEDKRPFVLHDWLYCSSRNYADRGALTRRQADELLRVAMIQTGHGKLKAWTYYYGVRM